MTEEAGSRDPVGSKSDITFLSEDRKILQFSI